MTMEPMLQGASNSWFALLLSALAIPEASNKLAQLVDDHWTILEKVRSEQNIELLQQVTPQLRDLSEYGTKEIWEAVQAKKAAASAGATAEPSDLKSPEWKVFIDPEAVEKSRDFQLQTVKPPGRYGRHFEKIVLAERLREVRALVGFARIESASDYDNAGRVPAEPAGKTLALEPNLGSRLRGPGRGDLLSLQREPRPGMVSEGGGCRRRLPGGSRPLASRPRAPAAGGVLPRRSVRPASLVRPRPHPPTGG
jgi:hypothetical protein